MPSSSRRPIAAAVLAKCCNPSPLRRPQTSGGFCRQLLCCSCATCCWAPVSPNCSSSWTVPSPAQTIPSGCRPCARCNTFTRHTTNSGTIRRTRIASFSSRLCLCCSFFQSSQSNVTQLPGQRPTTSDPSECDGQRIGGAAVHGMQRLCERPGGQRDQPQGSGPVVRPRWVACLGVESLF
jgi:hypothetical protein